MTTMRVFMLGLLLLGYTVQAQESQDIDLACPTRHPSLDGEGGELIAFVSTRDGNPEIYVMNTDGTDQQNLTLSSTWEDNPVWSPDGTALLFLSDRIGQRDLYRINSDGTGLRNLTAITELWEVAEPNWSPDGSKIVFAALARIGEDGTTSYDIHTMDSDGSNVVNLTQTPDTWNWEPVWSPDGSKIAYLSDEEGNQDIFIMNADGTDPYNLTANEHFDGYPAWSLDSQEMAFRSNREGNAEVYLVDIDGTNLRNLTNYPQANDRRPTFSPDGTQMIFVSEMHGNADIVTVDIASGERTVLTQPDGWEWEPAWSPDGSKVAYEVSEEASFTTDIYVMNADGSNPQQLTDAPGFDSCPAWSP